MARHGLTDSDDEPTRPPNGKTARTGSAVAVPRSASTAATTSRAANARQQASTSGARRSGSTTAARDEGRAALRYSVSVTPDPEPSSSILPSSDAPTVAAYASTSRAAGRASSTVLVSPQKPQASAAPARARPKPKRAVLDPEAQRQLELRRQKDREAADFFTHKRELNFRSKGVALKPRNPSPKKKDPTPVPGPSRSSASQSPSATPNKGKSKALVFDLDDDDGESSSSSISTDDDDSDGRGGSKPKKKKVAKPEPRRASPLKRSEPVSDSSSTDSDSSSTFGTSSPDRAQRKKDKHQAKKLKEPVPAPPRRQSRSLSPLEKVDSYTLAHAIQDMRRKEQMNRTQAMHASYQINGDDEESLLFGVTRPVASTSTAPPAQAAARPASFPQATAHAPIDIDDDDDSNQETQSHPQSASQITRPYTLAPLVEAKPLTEEELEAKYGPAMSINIQMVWDPRQPGPEAEHVRPYFEAFRTPLNFSVRQRENFNKLFERVAADKHIPKEQLTFTYNGKTVYSYGTPNAIHIISGATFLGFRKDVLNYIKQNKMMDGTGSMKIPQASKPPAAMGGSAPDGGMQGPLTAENATPNGAHASAALTEGTQLNSPSTPAAGVIPLTLRGGKDHMIKIQVPKTHTVFKLIKYFLKKSGLDVSKAAQCKLSFDGEELDHEMLIGDSEVEDEDTLDVKVPA